MPRSEGGVPPERDPGDLTAEERARALRRLTRLLLVGGIVFLAVVSLGLVPGVLSRFSPAAGRLASIAAWIVAPVLCVGLLAVAALRLRR